MPLTDFYAVCGPWVHPDTIAAVVAAESGSQPWAIGTPHGRYYASTRIEAEVLLTQALQTEKSVDIGLMQINSQWLGQLHVESARLLDPCFNVRVGTAILAINFIRASRPGRSLMQAMVSALSTYNSGTESGALSYAARVLRDAERTK